MFTLIMLTLLTAASNNQLQTTLRKTQTQTWTKNVKNFSNPLNKPTFLQAGEPNYSPLSKETSFKNRLK